MCDKKSVVVLKVFSKIILNKSGAPAGINSERKEWQQLFDITELN